MTTIGDLFDEGHALGDDVRPVLAGEGYRKLRRSVVLATATVSLAPLLIMTGLNLYQYERAFRSEAVQPIARLTSNNKRSLEFFLTERRSALTYIIHDRTFDELCNPSELARIINNMNRSLSIGAFVDLGMIDGQGNQLCYAGPYHLEGRNYADQDWFRQVERRGVFISDVFLGFRGVPHFAIATKHDDNHGGFYILRATIDAEMLSEQVLTPGLQPADDAFLVNRQGVLQTPSRLYGEVLATIPLPVPHFTAGSEVLEQKDENGRTIFLGYAYIDDSPYLLVLIKQREEAMGKWLSLRTELLGFLALSTALILGVILWGSNQFVNNMREANQRRAALLHHAEYSNKMASIGRLAAGVAHEINNPLAIINEKAGLLRDLVALNEDFPRRDKFLSLLDSVLSSVDRCSTITHRLLGFAKHMDIQHDTIDLPVLLREVLGFLGKEAAYRNLQVTFDVAEELPTVYSDRGQLQQVFLNLLNNAFAAVSDGGSIEIGMAQHGENSVAVSIADTGIGIPEANLKRIFEPFFTTKEGSGTGLGLSITYGIVHKLGGKILVASEVGRGTRFTVVLPVESKA